MLSLCNTDIKATPLFIRKLFDDALPKNKLVLLSGLLVVYTADRRLLAPSTLTAAEQSLLFILSFFPFVLSSLAFLFFLITSFLHGPSNKIHLSTMQHICEREGM